MAANLEEFLNTTVFPELKTGEPYDRFEDMSPDGKLSVMLQKNGDSILTIWPSKENGGHAYSSVEFCTLPGGGQSPRVRKAIVALAEAIRLDNEERKQYRR